MPVLPEPGARPQRGAVTADVWGLTDRGTVREDNEDNFLVAEIWRVLTVRASSLSGGSERPGSTHRVGYILAVADGLGGHSAGEAASRAALEALEELAPAELVSETDEGRLRRLVRSCEDRVRRVGSPGHPRQPGTTLTAAFVMWPYLHLAHVGDTRCYLVRRGTARQLTRDHTLLDKMRREGVISESESVERFEHVLTNAIGAGSDDATVEISSAELVDGDTLVLCSDGLFNDVSDRQIADIAGRSATARDACSDLLRSALHRDGRDNLTVVVARLEVSR